MKPLRIICYAWAVLVIALFSFTGLGYRVNFRQSADQGIYRAKKKTEQPVAGKKYVVPWQWDITGTARGMHSEGYDMLKEAAGLPGQTVTRDEAGQVYIDGEAVEGCVILREDKRRRLLPRVKFPIELSKDQVFVVSHNPLGWDSRYFGPVPWKEIKAEAVPVLIWGKTWEQ